MSEEERPLRLVLELEHGSEPIRGRITAPTGETREYVGWLALANALEELRRSAACAASAGRASVR
jgi:hypothetical protein